MLSSPTRLDLLPEHRTRQLIEMTMLPLLEAALDLGVAIGPLGDWTQEQARPVPCQPCPCLVSSHAAVQGLGPARRHPRCHAHRHHLSGWALQMLQVLCDIGRQSDLADLRGCLWSAVRRGRHGDVLNPLFWRGGRWRSGRCRSPRRRPPTVRNRVAKLHRPCRSGATALRAIWVRTSTNCAADSASSLIQVPQLCHGLCVERLSQVHTHQVQQQAAAVARLEGVGASAHAAAENLPRSAQLRAPPSNSPT